MTNSIERSQWIEELVHENIEEISNIEFRNYNRFRRRCRRTDITSHDRLIRKTQKLYDDTRNEDDYYLVKLPEPIFKHYVKTYYVRDELMRSDERDILLRIQSLVIIPVTSRRKDFISKNYKTKKYEVRKPFYHTLNEHCIPKDLENNCKFLREFHKHLDIESIIYYNRIRYLYTFIRKWKIDKEVIYPVYNTHQAIPITDVLRREHELREAVYGRKLKKRMYKPQYWDTYHDSSWMLECIRKKEADLIKDFKDQIGEYYDQNTQDYKSA